VGEDRTRGHSRTEGADTFGESGWITTEVAARAVRVSPRTIRRYIDQGKLEAKPQGEGVRREWLVSVDSLHALRASRTIEQDVPESDRSGEFADSLADVLREMSARLESRAEEAAELRVRLELTEQTQSTLEEERRRAQEELAEERRRREEAERERDDLRRELDEWRRLEESAETTAHEIHDRLAANRGREEMPSEPRESPTSAADEQQGRGPVPDAGSPREDTQRPWWRRIFG
jgi:chromosome segregation ATPase